MPLAAFKLRLRGEIGPAPILLSPVTRAYPSLRFRRFFHYVVRLTVPSNNIEKHAKFFPKSHDFDMHKLFTELGDGVNNR